MKRVLKRFGRGAPAKAFFVLLAAALLFSAMAVHAAANIYINSPTYFDLVDSGKHMDYDGNSQYMLDVCAAATYWNAYKSGVIREDSISVIQDVWITDINSPTDDPGVTSSAGIIYFNSYFLNSNSINYKRMTIMHELGHGLGLGHSTAGSVMYADSSTIAILLSQNDKDSYDFVYQNKY
jgi:hypothetical protein